MTRETSVLFNQTCPVCRAEIDHYAAHARDRAVPLRLDGLDRAADWGLTPDQAARRLHVRVDGRVLAGVPAFLALWSVLPRYRWLARIVGLPGVRQAAGLVYDRVLAPALYRAHLRRLRRAGGAP